MSVILVFSDEPDDNWMVANRVFFWFEKLIATACATDAAMLLQLEVSSSYQTFWLHDLVREQPDIGWRLVEALRTTAESVAGGEHPAPHHLSSDPAWLKAHFANLAARLRDFEAAAGGF